MFEKLFLSTDWSDIVHKNVLESKFILENLPKISLLENFVIIFWEAVEDKFPLVIE